jgi:hypothetical protein
MSGVETIQVLRGAPTDVEVAALAAVLGALLAATPVQPASITRPANWRRGDGRRAPTWQR